MVTCWFGDMHEVMNAGKKPKDVTWTSFYYGCMTGILPWIIMAIELRIHGGNDMPWFIWLAVIEYFILFFSFPINMYVQYMQWGARNNELYPLLDNGGYLQGERFY